ncbi:hypothetical protein LB504_008355 [Fusarium proliferatum]|nr:hypothetical protein LB504_008355 [Fusarium proliferatum]
MNLATTDRFSHRREKLRVFLPRPVQHVMPKIQRISCDERVSERATRYDGGYIPSRSFSRVNLTYSPSSKSFRLLVHPPTAALCDTPLLQRLLLKKERPPRCCAALLVQIRPLLECRLAVCRSVIGVEMYVSLA